MVGFLHPLHPSAGETNLGRRKHKSVKSDPTVGDQVTMRGRAFHGVIIWIDSKGKWTNVAWDWESCHREDPPPWGYCQLKELERLNEV